MSPDHAAADWVLFLDADERIARIGANYSAETAGQPCRYGAAFRLPRRSYFMSQRVRGWYPDRVIRLFERAKGRYTGIVHEAVHIDGSVDTLNVKISITLQRY